MDFAFTDEQLALRDTARRYLADASADLPDWDDTSWKDLVQLGWLDPDLGMVELGVLAEETGYALFPGPWLTTVALAAPACRAAGGYPRQPASLAWAEPGGPARLSARFRFRTVTGDDGLTGRKTGVPDGTRVTAAVVVASGVDGVELHLVDPLPAGTVVAGRVDDPTRPPADLHLTGTPATRLVGPADAPRVLRQTRERALTLLACEAVGVARRALEVATGHATTREQFGRPIGANQAVSHRLADGYAAVELARSLAYRAAWSVGSGRPDTAEAVLAAAVATRAAAVRVVETALQTLGAIGFTWEHPLHRWYRRTLWIQGFDGFPAELRAELAELLLGSGINCSPARQSFAAAG
jgi:alkylation response protein AidB-like acyl-CoA dehydrogenase